MTNKKKLEDFVLKAMKDCGKTQEQIGEAFDLHQSTISRKLNKGK